MSWYIDAIKNYVNFKGRSRRKAYWMWTLMNLIIVTIVLVLDIVIFGLGSVFPLTLVYGLFVLLPDLAVTIRRLHDVGKSGWWYLIQLVPLVGSIWLLVLLVTDSNPGENQYGPNPKAAA